jgi:hypothetical protein
MLAKKPAARYRNGDQLAAALEETMPSLEPAVMGAVAISDATESAAGGAVAGTAVADEITSENEAVAASPAPSRGRKVAWLAAVFVLLAILAGAAVWASMRDEDEPTKAPVAGEEPNVPKKHKPTASPTETSELDDAVPVASTPTPTTTEADTSGSGDTGGSGGSGSGGSGSGGSGGTGGSGSGGSGGGGGGGGSGGGGQTSPPPQSPTPEPTTTPEPTPSG